MTLESNTHPLDDLAVYALDALDPGERAVIDVHLDGCPTCRAELDRHLDTLSQVTTPEEPPAHLWDRIASQLPATGTTSAADVTGTTDVAATGPADVVPLAMASPRHRARRRRVWASPTGWLTAVAAAVVLVVGLAVFSLRTTESDTDVADLARAAAEDPDSTIVELISSAGDPQARVVVTEEGTAYVLLDQLPRLAEGQSYQLWKTNGTEQPVSLGVIGDGSADAAAIALPRDSTSFAISEEADEGVPAPEGPIVADGEIA
jgi:anti-sigma-K factor RskA